MISRKELRERLADLEHDRWSRWMRWMLPRMDEENLVRWRRQMKTPYAELSEEEKDSDRREADNTIQLLEELEIYKEPAT